jgi:diphthamide synthase (EF-2-diphthine--ammonia ligase)
MSVENIVNAIESEDSSEIYKTVNDELMARIASVIDVYKVKLADEMFNGDRNQEVEYEEHEE